MIKTLFTAAALLAATVSPALAKEGVTKTFTRDGETFAYVAIDKGDYVVLSGHSLTSGSGFELQVRGSHISGVSGGVPVSFDMPKAQAKVAGTTEVAAR